MEPLAYRARSKAAKNEALSQRALLEISPLVDELSKWE
jgi:hypothetical protein